MNTANLASYRMSFAFRNWMKLRFGIRETFAFLAAGLVFIVASSQPEVVFNEAHKILEDHEIVDLQDEAELRCWELCDWVREAREQTRECANDPSALARLGVFLAEAAKRPPSLATGEKKWWSHILALETHSAQGKVETLHRAVRLEQANPPRALINAARQSAEPRISRILTLLEPGGFDPSRDTNQGEESAACWQRLPAIWVACAIPKPGQRLGPDTSVLTMLVSLERLHSPRHLRFLMDENGEFLLHPYAKANNEIEIIYAPPNDLAAACRKITKWGTGIAQDQWQTQRSDTRAFQWPLAKDFRFYFLEGALRHAKLADDNERWAEDLRKVMERKGVSFYGAIPSSPLVRILGRTKADVLRASQEVNAAYEDRYRETNARVEWASPVTLRKGDIWFTRLYLHEPQCSDQPANQPDPPYYYVYAGFHEELASSLRHEMQAVKKQAGLLAVLFGLGALGGAILVLRPLTKIAETAQSVTRHAPDTERFHLQIEELRKVLPIRRPDELGHVARALESLLRQILNSHEQLRQLNLDLDRRVCEQTTELREANTRLLTLDREKDAFLASVSHELRQPLNSIFGFLQCLEFSVIDQEQKDDLAKLRLNATYLRDLINDILDYQKIIIGGMELDSEVIESGPFLNTMHEGMLSQAQGNRLEFVGGDQLGRIVNDRQRLEQVLRNLVSNACKFTQNGSVTVTAKRERDATGKDWAIFAVSDTGRGMKPEEKEKLFQKFNKLAAREGNKSGTGLGLVISKGLCKLMGGDIDCISEFGKGSTFTVRIPAEVEGKEPAIQPRPVVPTEPALPVSRDGSLVLVIDDDPAVRELITRFLEKKGYRVIGAEDGESGLALARKHLPAVITLDVVLPGSQNGWDVLARLKADADTANIPVIVVTFLDEPKQGFALGAADYIVKPIAWEGLVHSVRKVTHCSRAVSPVLVVDDDAQVRELFRRTLDRHELPVIEAADGREALERLREQKPSAILLDLMMPVMDGFEFMAEFNCHPEWSDIPVIVITAKSVTREDRMHMNGSVRTILEKAGFTQEDLLGRVLQLVRQHLNGNRSEQKELPLEDCGGERPATPELKPNP